MGVGATNREFWCEILAPRRSHSRFGQGGSDIDGSAYILVHPGVDEGQQRTLISMRSTKWLSDGTV